MKSFSEHASEVSQGKRFEFGKNWSRFLAALNDKRIAVAEQSLKEMLEVDNLLGKRFLDIGSGSGLFSLTARHLGACVHSFDYDPQSVACTMELKRRYFPNDPMWTIEEGSALDKEYMASLGEFDTVYAWGVLHHTGNMWQALENVCLNVAPRGQLFIAIYNDQGKISRRWRRVKYVYNQLPGNLKFFVLWPVFLRLCGPATIRDLLHGKPFQSWRNYSSDRGMSLWRDVVDWVGGYPFEVATPGEIFEFYRKKDLQLMKLISRSGFGNNEYVFIKQ